MANPATAAPTPGRTGPPWTAEGTVYFYGGFLSELRAHPGTPAPFGYHGHHENDKVPVATVEHWFQACKATSRQQFDLILTSGTSAIAKHTGRRDSAASRLGERQVPGDAVRAARQVRPGALPRRAATHSPAPAGRKQPAATSSGARRDADGGHSGQNLLGLALMQVRDELIADIRTRLAALRPRHVSPAQATALGDVQPGRQPTTEPRTRARAAARGPRLRCVKGVPCPTLRPLAPARRQPPRAPPGGRSSLGGAWFAGPAGDEPERDRLLGPARESDAGRQLVRCFVRWARALEHLRLPALRRLADNQPVDPNDPDAWRSRDEHAQAVLRRHGLTRLNAAPADHGRGRRTDRRPGPRRPRRRPGLDHGSPSPPRGSTQRCGAPTPGCRSRSTTPPSTPTATTSAARSPPGSGSAGEQADDLSRWVLAHPDAFDAGDLRCWRIASPTWLALADEQLDPVDRRRAAGRRCSSSPRCAPARAGS